MPLLFPLIFNICYDAIRYFRDSNFHLKDIILPKYILKFNFKLLKELIILILLIYGFSNGYFLLLLYLVNNFSLIILSLSVLSANNIGFSL